MRIDELTIKNFKGFENETFHFNQQFNVVIGKNASGKTSLLDAVSVAVGCYFLKIARTDARMITSLDVRRELIDGQPKIIDPVIISAKGEIHNQKLTWDRRYDFNHFVYSKEGDASITGGEALANIAMNDLALSRTRGVETTFPLILYYGTNRLWNQQEHINYFKQEEGFLIAYKDCLSGYASSEIFLSWYKTYEDEVSKFQQPADEILLKLFRDTISAVIPEWTSMAYSHKDGDLIGTFKDEDGQINRLPFSNLSDGYRNMIGMVADMVFRCIQLNPGLKERAVADTEGIVLIDEIDLHLHPQWQLTIVDSLKKVNYPFSVYCSKSEEGRTDRIG
jgi:predicted ATP-binding protein involved in virulence